jgi:hypothetical protein
MEGHGLSPETVQGAQGISANPDGIVKTPSLTGKYQNSAVQ